MPENDWMEELDSIIKEQEENLAQLKEKASSIHKQLLDNSYELDRLTKKMERLQRQHDELELEYEKMENRPDLIGLLFEEQDQSLHVYESDVAKIPFNAIRFKRDMLSSNTKAKVLCMIHSMDGMGVIPDQLPDADSISKEDILAAIDKLYECGYLTKYEIDGYGSLYKASKRGAKALTNNVTSYFFEKFDDDFSISVMEDQSDYIDDIYSIKLRFLAYDAMKIQLDSQNNESFYPIDTIVGHRFFLLEYMGRNSDESVCFIGIHTDDPDDFDILIDAIQKECFDIDHYVICGYTKTYIDFLSKWLLSKDDLEITEENLGYKVYQDPIIYSVSTDQPIEFWMDDMAGYDSYEEYVDDFLKKANLEDILTKQDDSLSYSETQKAKYSFSVNRFIKDLSGSSGDLMMYSLVRMGYDDMYKADYLEADDEVMYQKLNDVGEKMYNLGYFGKYTVENMDSFYVLTKRGKKIFDTRESSSMLRECSYDGRTVLKPSIFEIDNSNQAKLALVKVDVLDKVAKIDPDEKFSRHNEQIYYHYFILDFTGDEAGHVLCNIALISEDKESLVFFKDVLLDYLDEIDDVGWLLISGLTEKQAKAFSVFVADYYDLPFGKEKIYYTVYGEEGVYNLLTGEELKSI